MKLVLSLAAAFLFSISAMATDIQSPTMEANAQSTQVYDYDFGLTNVRMPKHANFDLTNGGPDPLQLFNIAVSGMDFDAFYHCPPTLPVGDTCVIRVRFQPLSQGFKSGMLRVQTNKGMIFVRLTGQAR